MVGLEESVEGQAEDSTLAIHGHLSRKLREASIREAIGIHGLDLGKVADAVGLAPITVYRYAHQFGIRLPYSSMKKTAVVDPLPDIIPIPTSLLLARQETLEALVEQRASGPVIGVAFDVSRERVRQLLYDAGLHDQWKARRAERRQLIIQEAAEKTMAQTALLSLFKYRRRIQAREVGWAHEMTVRHFENMRYENWAIQNYSTVFALFQRYEAAQRAGEVLSLKELGKPLDIHFVQVWNILRHAGVPPMSGKRHRRLNLSKEEGQAIERMRIHPIAPADIAYFLGLREHNVSQHYGVRTGVCPRAEPLWREGRSLRLTYCMASQIYEVQDCGFSAEETVELVPTSLIVVDQARSHRTEYEPKIVQVLQTLFNTTSINTPYVTTAERKGLLARLT